MKADFNRDEKISYLTRQVSYKNEHIARLELMGNFTPMDREAIVDRAAYLTKRITAPSVNETEYFHERKGGRYAVLAVIDGAGVLRGHKVVLSRNIKTGDVDARTLINWNITMYPDPNTRKESP